MIKSLKVNGLNNLSDINFQFNNDVNILTGRNGTGKTTVIKLMWYLISANLERILGEISFQEAELVTDFFTITSKIDTDSSNEKIISFKLDIKDNPSVTASSEINPKKHIISTSDEDIIKQEWILTAEAALKNYPSSSISENYIQQGRWHEVDMMNRLISDIPHHSIFFPTFRRIEGGFSFNHGKSKDSESAAIEAALSQLSKRISTPKHSFVTAISTSDITNILTQRYAQISEQNNNSNSRLSQRTIKLISEFTNKPQSEKIPSAATDILSRIEHDIKEQQEIQKARLQPFESLSQLIYKIFQHKGIRLSHNITLGEAKEAILSDLLSAGEKQMLSFVAYNTFFNNAVIFIDEPEISLHVDWQRTLIRTLLSQNTDNQFFITTHSPFIYTKYPDKEFALNTDRGNILED